MDKKIDFNIVNEIREKYKNSYSFSDLLKIYNINERYLCNILNNTRYIDDNYIKPVKINKNKVTLEEFIKRANEKHNFKYDYSLVNLINMKTKVIIICNEHGNFEQDPFSHLKGSGCKKCYYMVSGKNLKLSNSDVDLYLFENRPNILRVSDYINSNEKTKFKCVECLYVWETALYHIKCGTGCPKCTNSICDNEKIDKYILDNYCQFIRISDYNDSYSKMKWKCNNCICIWEAIASSIMNGTGCPNCSKRKNEKFIGIFLNKNFINYENICIKTANRKIYPDFFIPMMNLIIEYNGQQHYVPTSFGTYSIKEAEKKLERQKERDQELRNYCLINNIKLLEIDGREYTGTKLHLLLKEYFNIGDN